MRSQSPTLLTQPDAIAQYKRQLVRFMSWKDGKPYTVGPTKIIFDEIDVYPTNHDFTTDELLAITPEDIVKWFSLKAYHNVNPSKEDRPLYATQNSLNYTKKALSYFMVHSLPQWNDVTRIGNPTKSKKVNALVRLVGKMETRDQGKKSNADRAFEYQEVAEVMKIFSTPEGSSIDNAMYACMFAYQIHFIARIDDVSKSKKQWLSFHPDHPYCLMGRLPWSKNVMEQQDSPWQIIVGENEWRIDVLLRFALYLEMACASKFNAESDFTFCAHHGDTPKRTKSRASAALKRRAIDKPQFREIFATTSRFRLSGEKHKAAKLGSHSFRKYGKTRARRSGVCSKDEVDLRGRWKQDNRKASSTYEDTFMPFPDAKVAFQLCHGGPIGYELVPNSGLSDDWIVKHVTPNTAAVYGHEMALILGKALLWACYEVDAKCIVDQTLYQRIITACHAVRGHDASATTNPVQKVGLILSESNGVAIIEACELVPNRNDNRGKTLDNRRLQRVEMMLHDVKQNQINLQNTMALEFAEQTKMLRKIDRLQRRMAAIPARAIRREQEKTTIEQDDDNNSEDEGRGNVGASHDAIVPGDLLSRSPPDLYILWDEYQVGLGNRKPARLFTSAERSKVSSIYSKRNKVWKLITDLINKRKEDKRVVIDAIYSAYGSVSVTTIIKNIQRDEKTGGHPNLR